MKPAAVVPAALVGCLTLASMAGPSRADAQGGGFVPGGREIVTYNFAKLPVGEFPKGLKVLKGIVEVREKDGIRMLRASSPSELLITLPEALPRDFTIEFDLIPKACCNPEDLSFEGTAAISRSSTSAHILWHRETLIVAGGGTYYQGAMPLDLQDVLPGAMTTVAASFEGETIKLYTNGRRLFTLDRRFARGRVLRVFLGGQDDGDHAVYLARLRIAAGGGTALAVAQQQNGLSSNPPPGSSSGGPIPTFVANVTVTQGTLGPIVNWMTVAAPAVYSVRRWKADDAACCKNSSPADPPLTGPPWQDSPPILPGTYVYEVTARTNGGTAKGQAQFVYQRTGAGQIMAPGERPGPGAPTGGAASQPAVPNTPTAANVGALPNGLSITVTMGTAGPLVSWPPVPGATGYSVARGKIDDLNCCNASSGKTAAATSPWQDQPLSTSGTYVYTVTAETPAGQLFGRTEFVFTAAAGGPTPIASTPAIALPATPAPTLPAPVTAAPATSPTGSITPMAPSSGGSANVTTGRYRVTLTGFRVSRETQDVGPGIDGKGDEVYAAAIAVLLDRKTSTIRERVIKKTTDYGDVANKIMFANRIQAGTMSPTGGIWVGNGTEQVPTAFDPSGNAFPSPSEDRFPLTVWEGTLTEGVEGLLVVPTLWERDTDPGPYVIWFNNWKDAPLTSLFSAPAVVVQLTNPKLTSMISPTNVTALPFSLPLADLLANLRDHPIGIAPWPTALPTTGVYEDRYVVLTRENLAGLAPGGSVILPIPFNEPATIYSRGMYTLYLRVERLP